VNRQLTEANELSAIDRQVLQTLQWQLDLTMTQLEQSADGTDQDSNARSLIGKLSSSKRVKEQRVAQFDLAHGQQNKQIGSFGGPLLKHLRMDHSDLGRQEVTRPRHGKRSSVRSDNMMVKSYSSVISFCAVPVQDMSFCVQRSLICQPFRQLTAISDLD
jgi:hypothetical protein